MPIETYICYNGDFVKEALFRTDHKNRAFRYGDSLFETIRVSSKNILLFDAHIERLTSSMSFLKMEIPAAFNKDELGKQIIKLLNLNRLFQGVRVRLTVYRTEGGLYTPTSNKINYIIEAEKLDNEKYILNTKGLVIDIFKDFKKPLNRLSNLKTNNAIPYILAGIYKTERNLGDCLLLNENNNIIEAISSNLFVVKGRNIFTPSLDDGCLDGVMRNRIIEIALELNYIVFEDASIRENDLIDADELFLTNAISGIKWIGAFKSKRYYNNSAKLFVSVLNRSV